MQKLWQKLLFFSTQCLTVVAKSSKHGGVVWEYVPGSMALFRDEKMTLSSGDPHSEPRDMKGRLMRHADVALAILVVAVVGMMIVPMPTVLLDILISTNIAASVILLLTAIYVTKPLRIATFPTILLVTTLYRLALNVSSTRLILLQADAGAVIQSFGDFVVSGNMVVGAVIFLILTLIQFVVIAKGSERVAEVAARFTLDAMPGKQMAIDADLRSGLIDQAAARKRRQELERESQMYGSMDGAMKFVKGDAIAGILITLINITAGLIIGVSQMGMSWADALATYSILTIGDGLVSQIPALIISTSAGMIVTRVASEEESTHLGTDIGAQVLAQPKAIGIAAILMIVLAIIPGLPLFPFLVLGTLCGVVAWGVRRSEERVAPEEEGDWGLDLELGGGGVERAGGAEEEPRSPRGLVELISVETGPSLTGFLRGEESELGSRHLPEVRERIFSRLGLPLPPFRWREGARLQGWAYRIAIKEVPVATGRVEDDKVLVSGGVQGVSSLGVTPEPWEGRGPYGVYCWVPRSEEAILVAGGAPYWSGEEIIAVHLEGAILDNATNLMGIQQTQSLLDALQQTHPDLVSELVPKKVPTDLLSEVLKRLVEEGICIRGLADILESLAAWTKSEKDPVLLTEYARMSLKRQISHAFTQGKGYLAVHMLDPMIEETLEGAVKHTGTGSYLALEPELSREILDSMRAALEPAIQAGSQPVVLTRMEIRRYVKKLLEVELPHVSVLSFQELEPTMEIRPVGTIGPSAPAP